MTKYVLGLFSLTLVLPFAFDTDQAQARKPKNFQVKTMVNNAAMNVDGSNSRSSGSSSKLLDPVSGKAVPNKEIKAAYPLNGEDLWVYFENEENVDRFKKALKDKRDKELLAKARHQQAQTGQAKQVNCPVMSRKKIHGRSKSIVVNGVVVKVCCPGCSKKLNRQDTETQINIVFGKNFNKSFVPVASSKSGSSIR